MSNVLPPSEQLTEAQRDALKHLSNGPLARGRLSGWGPHGITSAQRLYVRTPTADALIARGWAEVIGLGLFITPTGRSALAKEVE